MACIRSGVITIIRAGHKGSRRDDVQPVLELTDESWSERSSRCDIGLKDTLRHFLLEGTDSDRPSSSHKKRQK